jgi:hypothetical protein
LQALALTKQHMQEVLRNRRINLSDEFVELMLEQAAGRGCYEVKLADFERVMACTCLY